MNTRQAVRALMLLFACTASAVAAWLNFRTSDDATAIRFGRETLPYVPPYADIRLAWLVALGAAALGALLDLAPHPTRSRLIGALLIIAAAVLVVISMIVSPAHFVLGTPHPEEMDPHRFDVAAWLCVGSAGAFLAMSLRAALRDGHATIGAYLLTVGSSRPGQGFGLGGRRVAH